MVFHYHDGPPMICEIIYPVGNGRLCSTRRERMVEVCPCNTYICIVCTINNHQMDNLERTSKKIITLTEHTDHLSQLPLTIRLIFLFRSRYGYLSCVVLSFGGIQFIFTMCRQAHCKLKSLEQEWESRHRYHQGWCISQYLLTQREVTVPWRMWTVENASFFASSYLRQDEARERKKVFNDARII